MKRGAPLQRKTPLRAKSQMRRSAPRARNSKPKPRSQRSPNEFPDETKQFVRRRSGGRCEAQTRVCTGEAAHFHHRKSRSSKDQRAVNALHLCSACHAHIHANVAKSRMCGWIVPSWADPAEVPVRRGGR